MRLKTFSIMFLAISAACLGSERLTTRIVPQSSAEKKGNRINCWQPFYVVLTNPSKKSYSIWRSGSSWSEQLLSFEVVDSTGSNFLLQRKNGAGDSNTPLPYQLKSGDQYVIPVVFDETWIGYPQNWKSQKVELKAIFEIKEDKIENDPNAVKIARENHLWIGRSESESIQTVLEIKTGENKLKMKQFLDKEKKK
ncbi:MAG: hypothetical protein JWO30_3372 [Fibrobacteres bacterium]|nr:hypothetical protein [Fibrobacterota bacterium]